VIIEDSSNVVKYSFGCWTSQRSYIRTLIDEKWGKR